MNESWVFTANFRKILLDSPNVLLGVQAAKLLGPYCFCNVFFPLKFQSLESDAFIKSRVLCPKNVYFSHNFILNLNMIKRFTGYTPNSPHKIFRPSLTKIIEQNLFYFVPFKKYRPIKFEQLAHFSYLTTLLLY